MSIICRAITLTSVLMMLLQRLKAFTLGDFAACPFSIKYSGKQLISNHKTE
jgi:hypothetical protein